MTSQGNDFKRLYTCSESCPSVLDEGYKRITGVILDKIFILNRNVYPDPSLHVTEMSLNISCYGEIWINYPKIIIVTLLMCSTIFSSLSLLLMTCDMYKFLCLLE